MLRTTITLIGISLLSLCFSAFTKAAESTVIVDPPQLLSDFNLKDQHGNAFGIDQFKGRWSMVFVGFTSCPDVCPMTLANLEAVRAEMGFRMSPERIPNIVFLAVDPDRDTALLKDYLAYFHPQYIGITGDGREIDKLIKGLDAFYRLDRKSPDDSNYDVVHTATVSIISPEAKVVAKINPPFHPHKTGENLMRVINAQMRLLDEKEQKTVESKQTVSTDMKAVSS
jgi:protein SCO1/2